ncbi:MAG TPA: SAM-dependent chlorinase/fluorinase [Solirubrobacteraceae bacterium]|nr:SAM-dependent chlorinase/fluorinase [Solirubrobacteraceae bacterium]
MKTISFLSDYGLDDEFVGVCHAVMARIAPGSRLIDLTHGVPRHAVRRGALILRNALPYVEPGVHLAVVDPEVGGERRAVALRVAQDNRLLVGPDNGLLALAAQRFGGVVEAVDIGLSAFRLEPVASTFHGRDIFAPVAARLAAGAELLEAGEPIDGAELCALELPRPRIENGEVVAHAISVDRYGNVALDVDHADLIESGLRLGRAVELDVGGRRLQAHYAKTFADVEPDEPLVYEDAWRTLALAVNRGSAAEALGLSADDELRIRPA